MTSKTATDPLPVLTLHAAEIASTASQLKAREVGIGNCPDLKRGQTIHIGTAMI
jgi:hypothetical protein